MKANRDPDYEPGVLLVKFHDDSYERMKSHQNGVDAKLRKHRARHEDRLNPCGKFRRVRVDIGKEGEISARLKADKDVEYATVNAYVHAKYLPTDPQLAWHNRESASYMPWAWDVSRGSQGVVAAVIDTGVKADHPDLVGKVVHSISFVPGVNPENPVYWHGTACAGTIAAIANNAVGGCGVASECKILAVSVLNDSGGGTIQQMADGVTYAADWTSPEYPNGAKVLSMSLAVSFTQEQVGLEITAPAMAAVTYATETKGKTIIVASSNDGETEYGDAFAFPGFHPNAITVAGVCELDTPTWFSNFSHNGNGNYIDISACADNVWAPIYHHPAMGVQWYKQDLTEGTIADAYGAVSGVSFATPTVAGAAALLHSINPNLTREQVRTLLLSTADATEYAHAPLRLNASRAVMAAYSGLAVQPKKFFSARLWGRENIGESTLSEDFRQMQFFGADRRKGNLGYWSMPGADHKPGLYCNIENYVSDVDSQRLAAQDPDFFPADALIVMLSSSYVNLFRFLQFFPGPLPAGRVCFDLRGQIAVEKIGFEIDGAFTGSDSATNRTGITYLNDTWPANDFNWHSYSIPYTAGSHKFAFVFIPAWNGTTLIENGAMIQIRNFRIVPDAPAAETTTLTCDVATTHDATSVEFLIDGAVAATSETYPYQYRVQSTTLEGATVGARVNTSEGSYELALNEIVRDIQGEPVPGTLFFDGNGNPSPIFDVTGNPMTFYDGNGNAL